jgi:hypothetical protein
LAEAAQVVFGDDTPEFQACFNTQRHTLHDRDPDAVLAAFADLA